MSYKWLHKIADDLRSQGYTANPNVTNPPTKEKEVQVDMSRFIPKPKTIEAVRWDGSTEGAAEVKALLDKSSYTMGSFAVVYSADGTPDKRESKISYYNNRYGRNGDKPPPTDTHAWKTYSLDDGWIVLEMPGGAPITVPDDKFQRDYLELGQVTLDDFDNWVRSAT